MLDKSLDIVNGVIRQKYSKYAATLIVAADGSGHYTNPRDAVNALPAEGGVVFIKPGTYILTPSGINFNKPGMLIGSGFNTIIKLGDNLNDAVLFIGANAGKPVIVANLVIDGNAANQTIPNGRGIDVYDNDCVIHNVMVKNVKGHGIVTQNFPDILIDGCIISDAQDAGILTQGANARIVNNVIKNCNTGINLFSTAYPSLISGNKLFNLGNIGILVYSNRNQIVGNYINAVGGAGQGICEFTGANYNIIIGNVLTGMSVPLTILGANTEVGHNIS